MRGRVCVRLLRVPNRFVRSVVLVCVVPVIVLRRRRVPSRRCLSFLGRGPMCREICRVVRRPLSRCPLVLTICRLVSVMFVRSAFGGGICRWRWRLLLSRLLGVLLEV